MSNPIFNCKCSDMHKNVANNIDLQTLEAEVFNKSSYTKNNDDNVYFVHDNMKQSFKEIYENLPLGDD